MYWEKSQIHKKTFKNPTKSFLSDFKFYRICPIITSGPSCVTFTSPTVNLGDPRSNGQYAISGGLRVRRLPTQKGNFPLFFASHVLTSLWDQAKPAQNHLPLEARLKSAFTELKIYAIGLIIPLPIYFTASGAFLLYFGFYTEKCLYIENPFFWISNFINCACEIHWVRQSSITDLILAIHFFRNLMVEISRCDRYHISHCTRSRGSIQHRFQFTNPIIGDRCIAWSQSPGPGSQYHIWPCLRPDWLDRRIGVSPASI